MGNSPKHIAVYTKIVADKLLERGYDEETIFRGTAFDASLLQEEAPMVEAADNLGFFEHAADLTKNDLIGFQLSQGQDNRRIGLISYVGLASPNVLEFLLNYGRYVRVVSDVFDGDLSRLKDQGLLSWRYRIPSNIERRQYVEYSVTVLLNTLRHYTGTKLVPRQVGFEHQRKDHVEVLEEFYGCKIMFGAECNSFEFKKADLELPLISADEQLLKVLRGYGDQVLAEKKGQHDGLIPEVEQAIADQLAAGGASLDAVASELGMSPRTLSRKLANRDTTFFRVLEDLRKSLSKSYLRDSDLALAEIAFLLGFSGLSSFNDAFKRWTGQSPGQFRAV
ncbi:AraC family transcriptional regulator [Parasedimentitalea huanghaiensis]|uniref:Helix-turn-helix domain-containing protein n=1 Tax=Parasedimentitalea huanghaiensis TaxID=2682100 RepID=A0A6L6WGB0_9RHOB|nr:AraC family transcriptional regulator [Zongyanglinia huanghaiensis]MVO15969.1 helix-turn-helix domain-containing protein [Zongyanglinia huanghaiensis]